MDRTVDHAGLEILTPRECEDLIGSVPVGRVGFSLGGEQLIFPVNHMWRDRSVVFRTAAGQKLAAAIGFEEVAFEVDDWDADRHSGWSVLVRGGLEVVADETELLALDHVNLQPWANSVEKPFWVRIVPQEITGRRVPM